MTTATGQAGKKRPQATPQEGAGTEELDKDEEEGAKYSDSEDSESDEEPTPPATKLLKAVARRLWWYVQHASR